MQGNVRYTHIKNMKANYWREMLLLLLVNTVMHIPYVRYALKSCQVYVMVYIYSCGASCIYTVELYKDVHTFPYISRDKYYWNNTKQK